jgi:hypothetical protein
MDAAKVRRFGDQSRRLAIVTVLRLIHSISSGQAPPPLQLIGPAAAGSAQSVACHAGASAEAGQFFFGASEATIFSKHGSPRSGSHNGISFALP